MKDENRETRTQEIPHLETNRLCEAAPHPPRHLGIGSLGEFGSSVDLSLDLDLLLTLQPDMTATIAALQIGL